MEGIIYTPGAIAERTMYEKNMYLGVGLEINNFYPGYKVKVITILFDYLGAYNKYLGKELNM